MEFEDAASQVNMVTPMSDRCNINVTMDLFNFLPIIHVVFSVSFRYEEHTYNLNVTTPEW